MSDYKLVPVEPTHEMIEAGKKEVDWYEHNAIYCYQAMLAAAPAVQGEPVGEVRFEFGAPSSIFAELYSKSLPALAPGTKLYTAPQPAEQQPELAKYQPRGCVICTCEHETQCQGCGGHHCGTHPVGQIPGPVYQQPAPDLAGLVEALTELCDEIDNHDIHSAISKTNILWFKRKARAALAPYRKGGEA